MSAIHPGEKLGHRHELAIAALLSHATMTEAAAASRISERTMRRYLRNRAFYRRYRRERMLMLDSVTDLLKKESVGAVGVLAAVARSKQSPASSRVSAAAKILELGFKAGEMQSLEKRVAQLEESLKERP